jgi:outer membrane protein
MLLVCIASCRAVHDARAAQDEKNAIPGERTPTIAELGLPQKGTVVLDDLVDIALRIHPNVVRAARDLEAAEARVRQAEGALWPQTSVDASIQYRDQLNGDTSHVQHRFESAGFSLSWLLFDFGRTRAIAHSTAEQWYAAQGDLRTAQVDVAFAVRNTYFDLSKQLQLLAVATETVQQFEARLAQVQEFVTVGTRIPYDATKSQVDLENARLTEVRVRDAVLLAQANLANAVGLAEVVDWTPVDFTSALPEPEDFDAAWKLAHEHQPALASALARERAASALVDANIAALYPSFDFSFGLSASGMQLDPWSWQSGLSTRWVPFNGFQNVASIDESAASLRAARATRTQVEQQTWLAVRTAWLAIEDARRRLDLTKLAVKSAEENLELAQGLFEVGRSSSLELTDAQISLAQARADDVQAHADEQAATAGLERAIGVAQEGP